MLTNKVQFKSAEPNPNLPQVQDISTEEVFEKMSQVRLIDVRRPDEWVGELGHIPRAELMTLDTLPMRLNELPKTQTIVFVCRSGARSAQATAFALENGYEAVFNMRGGMIEWNTKKYPKTDEA